MIHVIITGYVKKQAVYVFVHQGFKEIIVKPVSPFDILLVMNDNWFLVLR